MTADESRSLADQAADWVPPWDRGHSESVSETDQAAPESEPEPEAVAEEVVAEPEPEPEAVAEEVVAEPEPEPELELEPEAVAVEVVAEPELEPEPPVDLGLVEPPEGPQESKVDEEPVAEQLVHEELVHEELVEADEPAAEPVVEALVEADQPAAEPVVEALFEVDEPVAEAPPVEVPPQISDEELRGAVEAILLIVDEPVTEIILAQVLEQPTDRIAGVLGALVSEYSSANRGFELRRVAGGWRLYTRAQYAPYVEKFVLDGQQVRLTQAALETLAVVAYKQPVTRSRISAIRGVNCDGVVRTLVARGLIEECGTEPESGAFLYRTTVLFLEKLGLDSVDQLPPLAPFLPDDVDEIADAQR